MRRAQASLEFLSTYGWALMAMAVALGALGYFGVLNPSRILPERCNVNPDFICDDYQLRAGVQEAVFSLRQNLGRTIALRNITCFFPDGTTYTESYSGPAADWGPKQSRNATCIALSGSPIAAGAKNKVSFNIIYRYDPTGFDHVAQGEVYANAK